MDIFIRRLPDSTSRLDLLRFVSQALKPKWYELQFAPLGKIKACEICQIDDQDHNRREFHGLIRIEPARAAQTVIERLNGEYLNAKKVEVRKFFRRSADRDRRRMESDTALPPAKILEQRKRDRRRPHLVLQRLHAGSVNSKISELPVDAESPSIW